MLKVDLPPEYNNWAEVLNEKYRANQEIGQLNIKLTAAKERIAELDHVINHMVRESGKQIERERVLVAKHEDDLLDAEAKREKLYQHNKILVEALKKIAHSGPVDQSGMNDPYAGWSWCYDIARAALAAKEE